MCLDDLRQNRPAAEQLRSPLGLRFGRRSEPVQAFQNAFAHALGHRRHHVLLVHHGQVIEHALLVDIHPADTVLDDDGNLICERRVVRDAVRIGHREQLAVSVLMLQPFAGERRPPGGPAEQKAARP